jgi:hypothetical protein
MDIGGGRIPCGPICFALLAEKLPEVEARAQAMRAWFFTRAALYLRGNCGRTDRADHGLGRHP